MKKAYIDVGSTFVKFSIYDCVSDRYIASDKIHFPVSKQGDFSVPCTEIEDVIVKTMEYAAKYRCKCAYFSVQMHGYFLKGADNSISDYFSWRSGGGDIDSKELQIIDFSKRGTRLKENLPIAKLFASRISLSGTEFFTLGSYISYFLTGKNKTHITDACASGFYDLAIHKNDTESIEGLLLPDVSEKIEACGEYKGIKIYTPVGDHAASVMGSGVSDDSYLLNIGTTSQIAYVGEGNVLNDTWERRPYFKKGRILFTLSNILYGVFGDDERYVNEVIKIIDTLPPRGKILLGGGGASQIFERLSNKLADRGIACELVGCNIGIEGLKKISKDVVLVGTMLSEVPFTNMPLIMKNSGLDFMIVDNEHGAFDYTFLARLFTVSKLSDFCTVVRVPDNTRAWITKCVDAGADGFLLPMTNTAEDIKKVVEYAKYVPIGKRGISTMRAHTLYNPPALSEYMPLANEHIKVYAQIETAKGVENIEEILGANGVDGVFIGPNDLSCDLGCIGGKAPILEAIEKVANAAKKAGKPWGIITTTKALIEKATLCGASMFSYGSELNMLANECKKIRRLL